MRPGNDKSIRDKMLNELIVKVRGKNENTAYDKKKNYVAEVK